MINLIKLIFMLSVLNAKIVLNAIHDFRSEGLLVIFFKTCNVGQTMWVIPIHKYDFVTEQIHIENHEYN